MEGRHASLCEALRSRATSDSGIFAALHERLDMMRHVNPDNVEGFLSMTAKNLRPWANQDALMKEVRIWLEELRTHGRDSEGAVRIMTLRGAKGLEADIVCVVGLNDGILPKIGARSQELEETARLVYVSMTRARQELHLFQARKRAGSVTFLKESFLLQPSCLLRSIDERDKHLQYHQAPSKKPAARAAGRGPIAHK